MQPSGLTEGAVAFRPLNAHLAMKAALGRWPAHQPGRITMSLKKLCPVHRGLIVDERVFGSDQGRMAGVCPRSGFFRPSGLPGLAVIRQAPPMCDSKEGWEKPQ